MTDLAAQVCGMKTPRFEMTYCSQCGRETGPGDAGHSSCATHGPQATAPDLSGLEDFEYTTGNGLVLRCYLEHESGIDETDVSQGYKSRAYLIYAFAGVVDVAEVLAPDVVGLIEAEALKAIETEVV